MERYVYLILNEGSSRYKIGVAKNPLKRVQSLQTGSDEHISLTACFKSNYPFLLETSLHSMFGHNNFRGEWFDLRQEDVDQFLHICIKKEANFVLLEKDNSYFSETYLK